jgi:hypothetical protein
MHFNNITKYLAFCCLSSFLLYGEDHKLSEMTEIEKSFKPVEKEESPQEASNNVTEAPTEQINSTPIYQFEVKSGSLQSNIVVSKKDEENQLPPPPQMDKSEPTDGFVVNYNKVKTMEVTPDAGPFIGRNGVGVYVEGSYIYWSAREEGLTYAADGLLEFKNNTFYSVAAQGDYALGQGRGYQPDFNAKSGYKAGAGLNFRYDGWTLGALYTRLVSTANNKASLTNSTTGLLAPLVQTGYIVGDTNLHNPKFNGEVPTVYSIHDGGAHWHLQFNVLDVALARECFLSSKVLLKTHFGLKGTKQKQIYNVFYNHAGTLVGLPVSGETVLTVGSHSPTVVPSNKTEILNIALAAENTSMYNVQHYWGFGPRIGTELSWLVCKNFALFGEGAVSTLWGQFKDNRKDVSNVIDVYTGAHLVEDFVFANNRNITHGLNAVLELQIGLRYDWWSSGGSLRFRIQGGWENQVWFGQNHFSAFNAQNVSQNLLLQGATGSLRLDF